MIEAGDAISTQLESSRLFWRILRGTAGDARRKSGPVDGLGYTNRPQGLQVLGCSRDSEVAVALVYSA